MVAALSGPAQRRKEVAWVIGGAVTEICSVSDRPMLTLNPFWYTLHLTYIWPQLPKMVLHSGAADDCKTRLNANSQHTVLKSSAKIKTTFSDGTFEQHYVNLQYSENYLERLYCHETPPALKDH